MTLTMQFPGSDERPRIMTKPAMTLLAASPDLGSSLEPLLASPLLGGVDRAAAGRLAESFVVRSISVGASLGARAGSTDAPGIGILLAGQARYTWSSSDGTKRSMQLFVPGDIFGCRVVSSTAGDGAAPVASVDTVFASLEVAEFDRLMRTCPHFSAGIARTLGVALSAARDAQNDLVFLDTGARLAKFLLGLEHAYGRPLGRSLHVEHHLSHTDIGHIVGASRETVCKLMTDFDRRGWIDVDGRSFVIINRERLELRATR